MSFNESGNLGDINKNKAVKKVDKKEEEKIKQEKIGKNKFIKNKNEDGDWQNNLPGADIKNLSKWADEQGSQ